MTSYSMAVDSEGESSLTIIKEGQVTTVTGEHPFFPQIVSALLEEAWEEVADYLDPDPDAFIGRAIEGAHGFEMHDDDVYYGEDVAPGPVVQTLKRYGAEGRDTATIARFMERLAWNPNPRCREALMTWLDVQGLNLDEDGMIVAFKAVYPTDEDGVYRSGSSGHAFVDGVEFNGTIPQGIGSVVTMPREECDTGSVTCSSGLHIGTWEYANGFGPVLLEVLVDPVDVVSIPSGAETWKVRCCKYVVLAIHDENKGNDLKEHEPLANAATAEDVIEQLSPVLPVTFRGRLWKKLTRQGD